MTKGKLTYRLIGLTEEAWAMIDIVRRRQGRADYLEGLVWGAREIRDAAKEHGIEKQQRPRWLHKESFYDV